MATKEAAAVLHVVISVPSRMASKAPVSGLITMIVAKIVGKGGFLSVFPSKAVTSLQARVFCVDSGATEGSL